MMNRIALACVVCLLLAQALSAQTKVDAQQPASSAQGVVNASATSPELAQASTLSANVIKLYKEGKYDEALPLAKQALEIREGALGPEHQLVVVALRNLAELYAAKHNYGEAVPLFQRVLNVYEKTPGPNDPATAHIVDRMAILYYFKGDDKMTEEFLQRAISIREAKLGPEHKDLAEPVYNLAEFYRSKGEYKKAEPLYMRAIAIDDKAFGPAEPQTQEAAEHYVCFLYESKSNATELEKKFWESRKTTASNQAPTGQKIAQGGLLNGKALSLPKPEFPAEAKAMRASGIVRVMVMIDESGKVIEAKALCGHPVFAKPSVQAAYAARFSPTTLLGQPVKVSGVIMYRFVAR